MESCELALVLTPSELPQDEKNLSEYIFKALKKKEDTIIKGKGYLKDISKLDDIGDGRILINGDIKFNVKFKGTLILPIKDKPFTGNIFMISEHGIYIVLNKIRVFIPKANLPAGSEFKDNAFTMKSKKYEKGDELTCTIIDLSYKNDMINAIGSMITKKVIIRGKV